MCILTNNISCYFFFFVFFVFVFFPDLDLFPEWHLKMRTKNPFSLRKNFSTNSPTWPAAKRLPKSVKSDTTGAVMTGEPEPSLSLSRKWNKLIGKSFVTLKFISLHEDTLCRCCNYINTWVWYKYMKVFYIVRVYLFWLSFNLISLQNQSLLTVEWNLFQTQLVLWNFDEDI